MSRTRIKICGITQIQDAAHVVASGCDALGLVFYADSPRAVDIDQAKIILADVPAFVTRVALFVNPEKEFVELVLENLDIDLLQFHGDESETFCASFSKKYIKALRVSADSFSSESAFTEVMNSYDSAQGFLLDSYDPKAFGGTGKTFDWALIPQGLRSKIILAGGLNTENVAEAVRLIQPYAIDVSGGVECIENGQMIKGRKDGNRIEAFVKAVASVDGST